MTRFKRYLKDDGADLTYRLLSEPKIVSEVDYRYTLYEVDVSACDGSRYRHVLVVPLSRGAVSYSAGVALIEEDSARTDAGDFAEVERLANAVSWDFNRYRTFPAAELGRFVL